MNPTKLLEDAIAQAMTERAGDIRVVYSDMARKHAHRPQWKQSGYYDKSLARQYARVIAPRVAEILGADGVDAL